MLYALDHHVERLADDHARAHRLAEGLAAAGMDVDVDAVETNFISIDLGPLGIGEPEAEERLAAHGVLLGHMRPGILRAATHLDISDEDIDQARSEEHTFELQSLAYLVCRLLLEKK